MSSSEREMAELLAGDYREERLSAVVSQVGPDVSAILDLGCGIGVLTTRLAAKFPSTLIVGIDKSKYLLSRVQRKRNVMTILGYLPVLPVRDRFFDVAVAVQVLHEVLHFKGAEALADTFQNVFHSLKKDGRLIVLDHANPGDAPLSLRISEELQRKLREFQAKFRPRKIVYQESGGGLIRTSMRDFYDFVTKIWALNSALEEEEMSESHTPFTPHALEDLVQEAGFTVEYTTSLTSIDRYLESYGITVESPVKLPKRHVLLKARVEQE